MKIKFLMLFSLLLMIAGIVVSFLLFIQLQERNVELKKVSDQLDTANVKLKLANEQLGFRVKENDTAVVNKKVETIKDSIETITKVATNKVNPALIQKEKALRAKLQYANYFVGVFSLGVPSEKFNKTVDYLNIKGYSIVAQAELNAMNSWLANTSTVFYYDPSTRKHAQSLAEQLGRITNLNFAVQIGTGTGVPDGMEKQYLYVHLVMGRLQGARE